MIEKSPSSILLKKMFLGIRSIWRFIYAFIKHLRSTIYQNKFVYVHKKSANIYISLASCEKFSHRRYFERTYAEAFSTRQPPRRLGHAVSVSLRLARSRDARVYWCYGLLACLKSRWLLYNYIPDVAVLPCWEEAVASTPWNIRNSPTS